MLVRERVPVVVAGTVTTSGPAVALASALAAKSGTAADRTTLTGPHSDCSGQAGEHFADSWADVKGNGYLVTRNDNRVRESNAVSDAGRGFASAAAMAGC
jgi:hypothetical protein